MGISLLNMKKNAINIVNISGYATSAITGVYHIQSYNIRSDHN